MKVSLRFTYLARLIYIYIVTVFYDVYTSILVEAQCMVYLIHIS
jgi:hypothetical protein